MTACRKGHLDEVRRLLDSNEPDVADRLLKQKDIDGYTGLHKAAYNGHVQVVNLLLERFAEQRLKTPLELTLCCHL